MSRSRGSEGSPGMGRWRPTRRAFAGAVVVAALALPAGVGAALGQGAACEVSGVVRADTTWGPTECRSYAVVGNLLVMADATLTIAPGTTLRFAPDTALQVQGTLVARGTEEARIRFESARAEPRPGDWTGLQLIGAGARFDRMGTYVSGTVLEHCDVRHAGGDTDGAVLIGGGSPFLSHCTIEHSAGNGVFKRATAGVAEPGPTRIRDSRIHHNGANGVAANAGDLALLDNVISSNGSRGLYVRSGSVMRLDFAGNIVQFNGEGGLYLDFGFDGVIRDNVITDNHVAGPLNAGIAVISPHLTSVTITNNDLHDNRAPDGRRFDLRNASPNGLNAVLNWWGTTDRTRIAEHIVDFVDDPTLGAVTFEPFLSASNGRAPTRRLFIPLLERLK
ncbi:MAG: right-handed parallel beta-helix repeat-containing protein [Ardenticatenales bacterium]|nr:right-handed parallel beta-helix repeat-containing protein [Ardenticatenales bacterium]